MLRGNVTSLDFVEYLLEEMPPKYPITRPVNDLTTTETLNLSPRSVSHHDGVNQMDTHSYIRKS
jgi:hypothetical protein